MNFHAGQVLTLLDGTRRRIGEVTVERVEDDLVFADLRSGPDFAAVEPLFQAFEEAVDSQALKRVDALDAEIAALKLHLVTADGTEAVPIHDVQVWSDGRMTCRVPPVAPADAQGSAPLGAGENQSDALSLVEVKRQLRV
jgi:hypothetical protein